MRLRSEGIAMETNTFTLEVMVILGFQSTHPDGHVAKVGLNGPHG